MKAFILAAGRGERMRPLTDKTPKPLLKAGNLTLIEHRLLALKAAGVREFVINIAYLGAQIKDALGSGQNYGVTIEYSDEGEQPLECGGGIINALPLLGNEPFVLANADVWTDFDFSTLALANNELGKLVLISNPEHNLKGDFALNTDSSVSTHGENMLTYSGIATFSPELFHPYPNQRLALRPILVDAIEKRKISGQHFKGQWFDIGTPDRLQMLQTMLN